MSRILFSLSVAILLVGLLLPRSVIAGSCDKTQKVTVTGQEFLEKGASYSVAKESAKRAAVLEAIQVVNPPGYANEFYGHYSFKSDKSGDTENMDMSSSDFRRIRGMAKSVKIISEDIKKMSGIAVLKLEVDVEVCLQDLKDKKEMEIVIIIENIYWLDDSPSNTLRNDVIHNFPREKNIVVVEGKSKDAYSDIEVTGKVERIKFRSMIELPQKKSRRYRKKKIKRETKVKQGQALREGEKEFLEIVATVKVNAFKRASHDSLQFKKTLVSEIAVTDDPNWDHNRQYEAKKMVQVAFRLANKELVKSLKK